MPYALDANGNLTFDTYHSYAWDAEHGVWSIDSSYLTHDAFERVVEIGPGTNNTVVVYAPTGQKLSLLSASTESLIKGFVPLPGGGTAVFDSTGAVKYYRHADWLAGGTYSAFQVCPAHQLQRRRRGRGVSPRATSHRLRPPSGSGTRRR